MSGKIYADRSGVRIASLAIAVLLSLAVGLVGLLAPPNAPPGGLEPNPVAPNCPMAPGPARDPGSGQPPVVAAELMAQRDIVWPDGTRRCVGRCVAWETLQPIAGCQVVAGECVTTSGPDGCFELDVLDRKGSVTMRITAPGRVGVTGQVVLRSPSHRMHDVALRAAGRVSGLLADDRGQPCANRVVSVVPAQHAVREDGWQEQLQAEAYTRSDGSFRFALPVPAGALRVQVPEVPSLLGTANHVLRAGEELVLSLRCPSWRVDDELRGIVCDDLGEPIAGAMLQVVATPNSQAPVLQAAHSDSSGRFCLIRKARSAASVWLRTANVDGKLASAVSGPHDWGGSELRIQLSRTDGIWLQVADAVTGIPIEQFAVQHVSTEGVRSTLGGTRSHEGYHPGGRCWLEGIGLGSHEIIVWPTGAQWLPNLPHAFTREVPGQELRIALARASELPVTVLTESGRSVVGASVHLMLPAENQIVRDLEELLQHGGGRVRPNVRLAVTHTDERGIAMLRWADDDGPLQLRIEGPGIAPHIEHDVHLRPSGLTVRVPDTGVLFAALHGAAGLRVRLTSEDETLQLPTSWSAPLQLDRDGQIQVDVPVGSWLLQLVVPLSNGAWRTLPDVVAKVVIQSGSVARVQQSVVAHLAAGELRGSAFVDGRPARHVALLHGVEDANGVVRGVGETMHPVDDRGAFRFSDLRAGYYSVELRMTCSNQQVAVSLQGWRRLSGGQSLVCDTASVATAPLVIALRDRSGAAVTQGLLVMRGDNGVVMTGSPNARGLVNFERVPETSYDLQLRRGANVNALGRVALVGDLSEPRLVVVR